MPKNNDVNRKKVKQEYSYWRVTITYSDNEISGRVFKDQEKAQKYAARQERAPVVKKALVEPFARQRFNRPASRHRISNT
jgi:hypothetical protein